jgi:uncharacterized protein (DUF58 family)
MDREALHERIRRLMFASPALSASFVRGDFRSVFRGRGLDFESLREYTLDDDARLIDWNVSVRQARPFVRTYREDRSLSLFLLVDRSPSMDEGSGECSKGDMALLAASLLAHAASLRDMPVGGLHFSARPLAWREPRRGRSAARAFAEIDVGVGQAVSPTGDAGMVDDKDPRRAALAESIATVTRKLKRRSLVIVLSDWRGGAWKEALAIMARRHDVVAIRVSDPLEASLPESGFPGAIDPETGAHAGLALGSRRWREAWAAFWAADSRRIAQAFADCRVPSLELGTGDDPARLLLEFFEARRRKVP